MRALSIALVCLVGTAYAQPNPDTRFRPGANHHLGDDSFVKRFGRPPTVGDGERLRMAVHLAEVRAWLAARPATQPELATRRAEMLGYLDDYITRGTTPRNTHLPWRTPVFIDDDGRICAVGYLIERSVGRALAERIAVEHRYDVLEDIAGAMPDVATWIGASGFTLDELASIQPAYVSANVDAWRSWDLIANPPPDGPYVSESDDDSHETAGTFARHAMQGAWTVRDHHGVVLGSGELANGAGVWRGYYADGKQLLAEGPYAGNVAHGAWRFFHPSGVVAAEGRFTHGVRTGRWQFYNDTSERHLIAAGTFARNGGVVGTWEHYDADGKLLARTRTEGRGELIDVMPGADGVVRQLHQIDLDGPVEWHDISLERVALGNDQIYVRADSHHDGELIFDADGHQLQHRADGWTAADCQWSRKRVAIARAGDVAWLDELLIADAQHRAQVASDEGTFLVDDPGPSCGAPRPLAPERAKMLDTLVAGRAALRALPPTFVRDLVLGTDPQTVYGSKLAADATAGADRDLLRMLTDFTIRYIEWPHIDGQFERVFDTMPGRWRWDWAGGWFGNTPNHDPASRWKRRAR